MHKNRTSSNTQAGPLVALHGYGVRSEFWRYLQPHLENAFSEVHCNDLEMSSIESARKSAADACRSVSERRQRPVVVLGHSLGGVLAALTAQDLGPKHVGHVCILAAPFGDRNTNAVSTAIGSFLLRFRLIPAAIARPRFFSSLTPIERQKDLFRHAVPETPELQRLLFSPRWFHSDELRPVPEIPYLMILSEADKVVPSSESLAFAQQVRAQTRIFDKERGIGHDDFATAPSVLPELVSTIEEFVSSTKSPIAQ